MFDQTPLCPETQQSSGINSECELQYERTMSIDIDIPNAPADVWIPLGMGKCDTGHVECMKCGSRWAYTLVNGQVVYIPRQNRKEIEAYEARVAEAHSHSHDCDHSDDNCESCKP